MDQSLLGLLESLDDPLHLEHPPGFAHNQEQFRFVELVNHLNVAFACRCWHESGMNIQDASYLGAVEVPADATVEGIKIHIRVSNFGRLALVCPERPGCYDENETRLLIAATDRERIEAALRDLGYVAVPEELLSRPRGMAGQLEDAKQPAGIGVRRVIETWYDRFFDYL
jgi:hypothetical protein